MERKLKIVAVLILATGLFGCGKSGTTRALTGTVNSSSLSGLYLNGVKNQTVACGDLQVICSGYTGEETTVDVEGDCTFRLELPLESFCFCGIFDTSGSYIAALGCAEGGYEGAIPVFLGADDSEADIDIGGVSIEGDKGVSTVNACSLVDQDNDGTADATDTDDDGDGTGDGADFLNGSGCEEADNFDSDGNDIPDIFEDVWVDQTDEDDNNIPDFCETDCTADTEDTDGDCIPDSADDCFVDTDGDAIPDCIDCDNSSTDLTTSLACYDDLCTIDSDGDGFGLCGDCDDEDSTITNECEAFDDFDPCTVDDDNDGVNFCDDCDDGDSGIGIECTACELTSCDSDFECQQFAENQLGDDDTSNDACPNEGVSCLTCVSGCCEVTN